MNIGKIEVRKTNSQLLSLLSFGFATNPVRLQAESMNVCFKRIFILIAQGLH